MRRRGQARQDAVRLRGMERTLTRKPWLRACPALVGLLVGAFLAPAAGAQGVDTFHLRLYQDGAELAAAGRHGEAVGKLRLACFGMLDRPSILGPCLGRLLVAQDEAGVSENDLEATVDRLLEVESRFKGWSEPASGYALPDDLKRRVASLFARFGTVESLNRIPGLGDAALKKQAEQIAALPLGERRKELNVLVQRQARVPLWHVMSAELSLEAGDPAAAAGAARLILETFEGNAEARCVLGRARAAQNQCDAAAIENLRMCSSDHPQRSAIDLALVECLVASERWSEADTAWRRLPTGVQDQRAVRRLRKQIEKELGAGAAGGAAGTDEEPRQTSAQPRQPQPIYAPPPGIVEEDLLAMAPAVLPAASDPPKLDDPNADAPEASLPEATLPEPSLPKPSLPKTTSAEFGELPDDEQETLRRVRDALALDQRHLYADLWPLARKVAKRHDDSAVAQRLAGSLAFHLGKWRDAARFLRRDESLASSRPSLQLELAIALHYQGDRDEARREFERCRPVLASSAWVEYWAAELG